MRIALLALTALLGLSGCSNHYLIHPKKVPPTLTAGSDRIDRGALRMNLQWVRPPGEGPFPTVLVHPEARHVAKEMRGILRSLALEGYLAVAADYRRLGTDGSPGGSMFAWKDPEDVRTLVDHVLSNPDADPERIGAIGYSQGGVYSLLLAAETQDVAAVVAYYPITDFEHWLYRPDRRWMKRQVFELIGRYFRRKTGAENDQEFQELLRRASPLQQAEKIHAPVLLIHGDRDTSADVDESRRLAARLEELDRTVELLEIEGAGHVFNFRNAPRATRSWQATLAWLDRYLKEPA